MNDVEHANLTATLESAQPQAAMAMTEMKAAGLNLFQIITLIAQYGPAIIAIFGNAQKYVAWIQAAVLTPR